MYIYKSFHNWNIISEEESAIREQKWKLGIKEVLEFVKNTHKDAVKVYISMSGEWMYEYKDCSSNACEYVDKSITKECDDILFKIII